VLVPRISTSKGAGVEDVVTQILVGSAPLLSGAPARDRRDYQRKFPRPSLSRRPLITTAVVGIPIRLYLISAVGFNAPGFRERFLHLFPMIFVVDEL
jgi:hypothetical protein